MDTEYNNVCLGVNKHGCLPVNFSCGSFSEMNYGERLQAAMQHGELNQVELATRTGVSQQNISRLIRGKSNGSIYTVRFAKACGVRPEWLEFEQGEMVDGFYVDDPKLKAAVLLMQELPEYAIDAEIKRLNETKELIQAATRAAVNTK